MKKAVSVVALVLVAAIAASAQGVRYDNFVLGPRGLPSGGASVEVFPATGADVFTISAIEESGTVVTATTSAAHGFTAGQTVSIADVLNAGYDGLYTIVSVPSPTTFTYICPTTFLAASSGGMATVTPATIYSDEALEHPTANPFEADSLGNYGFWDNPGHYVVQLYGSPYITRAFDVFLPCDRSAGATACGDASTVSTTSDSYDIDSGTTLPTTCTDGHGFLLQPDNIWYICVSGSWTASISQNQTLLNLPTSTFACASASTAELCQMPFSINGSVETINGAFTDESASTFLRGPLLPPGGYVGIGDNWEQPFANPTSIVQTVKIQNSGDALLVIATFPLSAGLGGYCTDSQGNTLQGLASVTGYNAQYVANLPAGSDTVTCPFQRWQGTGDNAAGGILFIEVSNFGGADVAAVPSGVFLTSPQPISLTTTGANETLLYAIQTGRSDPPNCGNQQSAQLVSGDGVATFARFGATAGSCGNQIISGSALGAAQAGTYTVTVDASGTGTSFNMWAIAVALKPANPSAPVGIPYWGTIAQSDLTQVLPNIYSTIEVSGSPLPAEPYLNLLSGTGATVSCADNAPNSSTDCTVGGAPSAGTITLASGAGSHTFATPYAAAPVCTATDTTSAAAVGVTSTTTAVSVTGTGTDVVAWICTPAFN